MPSSHFKTADLFDEYGYTLSVCDPMFSDYGGSTAFHGVIRTLKCFEDNSKVREMLQQSVQGDVLVVDAGGSLRCAMLGDQLAQLAVDHGWSGIVMYGCVRDADEISAMPLGVKALAAHPAKSRKNDVGDIDLPVTFAGVKFMPGSYLYADRDGIVVSATELAL
ncbi:MAG: ribonuclease E activity regulator RraA [Chromatiales bacterium]|jgi:regulator of ribonuclease activity A